MTEGERCFLPKGFESFNLADVVEFVGLLSVVYIGKALLRLNFILQGELSLFLGHIVKCICRRFVGNHSGFFSTG